jgi:serine/threonine protein kinase/dipeptidyl aminopeptidase/acylaminoacyl peptidase
VTNQDDDDKFFEELADAILEGKAPADGPDAGADAERRASLRQAEILARIADLHQHLPADDTALNGSVETGSVPLSWGRLTILEELGRGAFGAVYRARDPRLDREVALKLLWAGGADHDRFIASMVEEGRLLARIHHPNVVTIYDANVIDGRVGLTMEFVRGQTLSQEFQARGPFTAHEAAAVGVEIARALAAVHEAGLLHRDVKTQNVMRRSDGRLVLMDFGAGRPADGGTAEEAAITGTPLYLAPEVLEHQRATVQSDIYGLGVLLFYLLTGAYPVSGNTIRELRDAHRTRRRKAVAELRPDVPPALAAVIERALAATPSGRWASAGDMVSALRSLERPARSIWKAGSASLVALIVVLGAALAFVLLRRPNPDEDTLTIRQVTTPDDLYLFGRLSYDGKYLPYSGSLGSRLILRNLLTGEDRALFDKPAAENGIIETAVVSRDNARIAFSWETEAARELRIIDFSGGNQRVVLRDETPGGGFVTGAVIAPIDWTSDGSRILALRTRIADSHDIVLVDTRDGAVRTLKSGLQWPVSMSLSRDSRYVVFDHPDEAAGDARDISLLTIATGEEYRLVHSAAQDALPVWMPDDRGVMFTSDRSGTFGLWMVPLRNGRPTAPLRMIRKDIGLIAGMSLADDGTLFYTLASGDVDVHVATFDVERGVAAGSVTAGAASYHGSNLDPEWSPDGRWLAHVSRRRAMAPHAQALVIRSLADGNERILWPNLRGFTEPRWSPDGRQFVVRGNDTRGRRGPWLLDATTGEVTQRIGGPGFVDMAWARDNRSLFVIAQNRVARFDLASGQMRDIHRDARKRQLAGLAVSPDEQWLAITTIKEKKTFTIEVLSAAGGPPREVFATTRPDVFMLQAWTRDGANLLISRGQDHGSDYIRGDWSVWSVPVSGGQPLPLNLTAPRLRGVKVSPDGSRLAYRVGDPGGEDWIMRNFLP